MRTVGSPSVDSTPTRNVCRGGWLVLGIVLGWTGLVAAQTSPSGMVVLQAERSPRDAGSQLADYAIDVYVNAAKVGSLKPSEKAEFRFRPRANGINEMTFKMGQRLTKPGAAESFFSAVGGYLPSAVVSEALADAIVETVTDRLQPRYAFTASAGQRITVKVTDSSKDVLPSFGTATSSEVRSMPAVKPNVLSVRFDPELKRVVKRSLPVGILSRGASKTYSARQTVSHSVTTTDAWRVGGETRVGGSADMSAIITSARASIEVAIRGEIERATSTAEVKSEEHERSATIVGDGKTAYRVVWAYYYKTGTARVVVGGKTVEMPFEYEDNFDIESEEVVKK